MKHLISYLDQLGLLELAIAVAFIVLWFIGLYLHDWTRRFMRRH